MSLNSVQAHAAPGIVYKVYLDLPANASPDVAGEHFVGVLNFFDKAMPRQEGSAAMAMGKTVAFDITDVAQRVRRQGEEDRDFKVTLVPTGAPKGRVCPDYTRRHQHHARVTSRQARQIRLEQGHLPQDVPRPAGGNHQCC